jgi:peptide/nickel transport system substrate-binding protein
MTLVKKAFWRRWFTGLLAVVLAIGLSGCDLSNFKSQAAQVSQIVSYAGSDPKTFNYAFIQEYPNIRDFCYQGLVGADGQGRIIPALAESWQISDDKQRITFTLRDGLKWSDGEPLTVDDVLFTYNDIYLNKKIPSSYTDGLRIGQSGAFPTVRKLDDRRVEFASPEPFAPLLRATGLGILPAHALRQSVQETDEKGNPRFLTIWGIDTDPTKIIVNGPYKIESYLTSQRLVFQRNPYYWEKDEQGNPLPYVERVIIQIVESIDTALLQFRSKGLDILLVGPQTFSLLKREEKRGDFTIYDAGPDSGTSFILFNLNKGRRNNRPIVDPIKSRWFNTVAFRQAVAYALDRDKMNNNTFRGLGVLQNSPISVQSPYYLSPEEGLKVYNHNLEKAKQLLQGAGFKYDSANQLFDADGNRVRFTMISQTGNKRVEAMGAQVKQDLSKVGIQVDYQPIDFGTIGDKLSNTYDWECWLGFVTGGIEPHDGFNVWSPDGNFHLFNQKPQPGQPPIEGREVADWEQRIGELYIQGARELDEAKRKAIYAETQRLSQEYLPFIHLVNNTALAAVRNHVKDVELSSLYYESVLWNSPRLKVVEED